jgi:hypothetical protein
VRERRLSVPIMVNGETIDLLVISLQESVGQPLDQLKCGPIDSVIS